MRGWHRINYPALAGSIPGIPKFWYCRNFSVALPLRKWTAEALKCWLNPSNTDLHYKKNSVIIIKIEKCLSVVKVQVNKNALSYSLILKKNANIWHESFKTWNTHCWNNRPIIFEAQPIKFRFDTRPNELGLKHLQSLPFSGGHFEGQLCFIVLNTPRFSENH